MAESNRGRAVRSRRAAVIGVVSLVVTAMATVTARPAGATPSTGYRAISPMRVLDTRDGAPVAIGTGSGGGPLAPLAERAVALAGQGPIPADTTRVALRVTVTDATSVGDLYVHPCGAFDPSGTILIRTFRGETESQLAFAVLVGGSACVTVTTPMHVIVDLEGYEAPGPGGAAYVAVPDRAVATRLAVGAGAVVPLSVVPAGVPTGSMAVSATLTMRSAVPGYVTVFRCDSPRPLSSTEMVVGGASAVTTAIVAPVSVGDQICVFSQVGAEVDIVVHGYWAVGATPTAQGPVQLGFRPLAAPTLVAVTPRRLFDTRSGRGPVAGGTVFDLDLTSAVPRSATDVVLNATVTEPGAAGYVTVFPCDAARPTASNLNFVAGQTVPNLVTVSLGASGHVCFYASVTTHLLADLSAWYDLVAGSGFQPASPSRLFDTRGAARVGAGAVRELSLDDRVPADATAVVMNVTATEAVAAGYVTVYPCSAARPTASNLNVSAGLTAPNLVTVAVGADRRICFFASVPTHLLADLAGSYTASSTVGFVGLTPERVFDTRLGTGRPLGAGDTVAFTFGPAVAASPDPVVAVVLNLTVAEPVAAGFVTAYPCAAGRPTASNLNYVARQVVPNLAVVTVDEADDACFYTQQSTHLLADIAGFFTELPLLVPEVTT